MNNTVALVLGLQDCRLGIVRSLAEDKTIQILGLCGKNDFGRTSRYLEKVFPVDAKNYDEIRSTLLEINKIYNKIIPFPAGTDKWVTILADLKNELTNFVIDYGDNIGDIMSKEYQAALSERLHIPYPKSFIVTDINGVDKVKNLRFPIVVKPTTRNNIVKTFRILQYNNFENFRKEIKPYLAQESIIVSEFIEGDDSTLYTYGSYAKDGDIVADFTGRKLFQKPPIFGVAGVAENLNGDYPFIDYSKKLLKELKFSGISQLEYKRDVRNNEYYLTEINPRAWLWLYLATKCGMNLPLTKYYCLSGGCRSIDGEKNNLVKRMYISEKAVLYDIKKQKTMRWFKIILKRIFSHKKVYSISNIRDMKPLFTFLKKITTHDD